MPLWIDDQRASQEARAQVRAREGEERQMTYKLRHGNWPSELARLIHEAKPGDSIQVDTDAKRELGERAMKWMDVTGVKIEVSAD